jgi:DNA-binding CsgD family transcriptional regulator
MKHDPRLVGLGRLSDQEFDVAELIAKGLPLYEIADILGVGESLVHVQHRVNIFTKLGVQARREMMTTWERLKAEALRSE